jgi:hypothetical protein
MLIRISGRTREALFVLPSVVIVSALNSEMASQRPIFIHIRKLFDTSLRVKLRPYEECRTVGCDAVWLLLRAYSTEKHIVSIIRLAT